MGKNRASCGNGDGRSLLKGEFVEGILEMIIVAVRVGLLTLCLLFRRTVIIGFVVFIVQLCQRQPDVAEE